MDGWKITAIVLILVFVVVPLVFLVVGGIAVGAGVAATSRRVADPVDGMS